MKGAFRSRIVRIALALPMAVVAAQGALAQGTKPTSAAQKTHATGHPTNPAPKKVPTTSDAGASGQGVGGTAMSDSSPAFGAGVANDAGVVESRTLDGGTRVFKFSELDIEGRLKSPQLVYFLRRVRAEFGAGDLGHRSFLREMSETRKEPTF